MGRIAEGYTLHNEPSRGWVLRFTHEGQRRKISCRTRDPGEAAARAPSLYAEAVSGKRPARRLGATTDAPLDELVALWAAGLTLSPRTVRGYLDYARGIWLVRWSRIGELTETALRAYTRERLGVVTRTSVRKEIAALRGLLAWAVEEGLLPVAPVLALPPKARGTRTTRQRRRVPVPLSAVEVRAILAHLPERAPRRSHRHEVRAGEAYPVRAYCEFLWETGLRPATVEALSVPEHWRPGADLLDIDEGDDKSGWGRRPPLSTRAQQLLATHAPPEGPVWGRYRVEGYLRAAARAAGVEEARASRVAAYDLRHARVTALVDAGATRAGVQFLAGHRHAATTDRYLHPLEGAARAALALLDEGPAVGLCGACDSDCTAGAIRSPSPVTSPREGPFCQGPTREVCSPIRLRGAQGGT